MRSADAFQGKFPELQNLFFSPRVTDVRRRMDGFHYFPALKSTPPLPSPNPLYTFLFLSVWKEAWCPLESPSQAKETLLSPGNLGPSENKLCMNRQPYRHFTHHQNKVRATGTLMKFNQ